MKITKRQLQKIIKEEKQKLLKEASPADMSMHDAAEHYKKQNVPSALGMEILSIKDALFDILMGVRYHDEELAQDLELQIERLRELGYKKA